MQLNDKGLELIKHFEGCRLDAYQDQGGIWTIGYGHTGNDVFPGLTISQEKADSLLKQDIEYFTSGVAKLSRVSLNDNQFSALISFAYNLGLDTLKRSTLLRKLNNNDFSGAAAEFIRWDHVAGKVDDGLLKRREAEKELFLLPIA